MPLPPTSQRVARHSPTHINERIAQNIRVSIDYYQRHPEEIPQRLQALEREWDIERVLEANASSLVLAGLGLGLWLSRRFLILPVAVGGFLLQHALQGWCPPVPVLRRLGFRTQSEIDTEKNALLSIAESPPTTQ
ncbi:MAG: YgaP-like transmembrane domain [Cellvibrionaceae bacterium]